MKKNILIAISAFMTFIGVYAQKDTTLTRTVVVENEYNPEIMDASKINLLPKVNEQAVNKRNIDYINSVSPFTAWDFIPLPPNVLLKDNLYAGRGYVNAGYGNYGNAVLSAGYRFNLGEKDMLNIKTGIEGKNGTFNSWDNKDWSGRFYNTSAAVDYSHQFRNLLFKVGGDYTSQVYNYMNSPATDKQHNSMADIHFGIASSGENLPLYFSAQIGYSYFDQKYSLDGFEQGRQSDFYINGDVYGKLNEYQRVGIKFDMDNISYSSDNFKSYTSLCMNPYFSLNNDDWNIRIGAHVDWQSGNGGGIDFSPDIKAEYLFSDSYVLYINGEGGRVLNDFNRLNSLSPYFIMRNQLKSTYVPLDAKLGFKASPVNGLWFNAFAGYRMVDDELSYGFPLSEIYYTSFLQDKAKCGYIGGEIKYDYKDKFNITFNATSYSWKSDYDKEDLFLAAKPKLSINIAAEAEIIDNLRLNAGYEYMKRGKIKLADNYIRTDLGTVSNLYLGANYELFKNITVFVNVNNLFNKQYYNDNGYPVEKLNFIGGMKFIF